MKFSAVLLAASSLITANAAANAASPPVLDNSYCADVTETLSVEGVKEPLQTNSYNLCVDGTSGTNRWSQEKSGGAGIAIFNGTDFWMLAPDSSSPGGYKCTHKYSGPEPNNIMPYTMTLIDAGADLNKTETYDGVKNAQNWYHFRPGQSSGGMQTPTEYMHWHASTGENAHLLASECIQDCPRPEYKGKLQHGVRDQSANRTKFIERKLPSGVKCTEAASKPFQYGNFHTILFH